MSLKIEVTGGKSLDSQAGVIHAGDYEYVISAKTIVIASGTVSLVSTKHVSRLLALIAENTREQELARINAL